MTHEFIGERCVKCGVPQFLSGGYVTGGRCPGKVTDPVPAPSVCGESVNDHNSTGLVFTCSLQKGHEGDHYDINANRGWRAVPAPSAAETLREMAKVQDELISMCVRWAADPATADAADWRTSAVKHQLDKEALEAGARALEEREKLVDELERLARINMENAKRVLDRDDQLQAAEQREAQASAALREAADVIAYDLPGSCQCDHCDNAKRVLEMLRATLDAAP